MGNRISTSAVPLMGMLVLLTFMGGCTNLKHAPLDIHYYTLEYDPPQSTKAAPLPFTVKIDQFQTSPVYDSNRIIFKEVDYTRDEYTYHKWRALPGELVSFFMARDFADSGLFQSTLYYESGLAYTHLITGMVEDFYWQKGETSQAVLSLTVNVVANADGKRGAILAQKIYRLGIQTQANGPQGFAMAMSTAMQQVSAQVLEDVSKVIQKR